MKKIFQKIIFVASLFCSFKASATFAPYTWFIFQGDDNPNGEDLLYGRYIDPPASNANGITGIVGATGTIKYYLIGDGLTIDSNTTLKLNLTSTLVNSALGYTPYNGSTNPNSYVNVTGARSAITLTTTGSSGPATYNSSTGALNIPSYGTGTVTSVGVSSSDLSVSGSPVTTSGSITLNLNTSGVSAGTYSGVTVNTKGIVTAGTAISINDNPGRSLVSATNATGFQISSTRAASVCYEGTFQTTSTIGGPASVSVFLETADTNSTTPGDWTTKASQQNSNTITLAVVLQQVDVEPWSICRNIPAGKFIRLRTGNVTGTAAATITTQQETTL